MGPGEIEIIAPMIFGIIMTLTIGGVILLKPLANKLGGLLEERQDFTEALLSDPDRHRRRLGAPEGGEPEDTD